MYRCHDCADQVEAEYWESSGGKVGHLSCKACGGPVKEVEMPIVYRDYEITVDHDHPHGGWKFTHQDYDGPPDDRCGHAFTLASAMEQIDDIEAMRADKLEEVE